MRVFTENRPLWLLLGLIALGHLPLMAVPPLTSDEAFYWEWARHLALGYYSHPPMVGWTLGALRAVLGDSQVVVRLTALLYHLGTVALLYTMLRELTGETRLPLLAGVLYALTPVSLILGTMTVTDCPLIFFWTATAWLTKRAVIDGRSRDWYAAGVAAGATMLSKFFAVLFYPGLLAFLLLHPQHRGQLARKEPWLAVLIALLVFSPFVYWNATHQWLTLQFNLVNRQGATGLDLTKPLLYVAGQMIAASPVVLVALVPALAAVLAAGWRRVYGRRAAWREDDPAAARREDALLYYAVLTAVPLLIFLGVSLVAKVGAHWAAVVYPTGIGVLVAWLAGLPGTAPAPAGRTAARGGLARPRWAWACGIGLLVTTLPLAALMLYPDVLPARYVTYDEARERTPDGAKYWGWEEAGEHMARLREQYGGLPGGLFFSTRDYSDASMLGFYSPLHEQVVLMGYRREEFHGKEFLYWDDAIKRPGANTIFVMDGPIFPDDEQRIRPYFRAVRPLETLLVRAADGTLRRKFYFALGLDYQANEPDVLSRW